ncbi:glutathione S-transferase family protein [Paraferrimonas sp. SM1919]|uniref:glutathione S-transferase family protein n=1 Tax=Paraferrimonas sp. SM1919 TaxID=2662263 RepID=UPI0013D8B0E8|nr:glutathione S-transferase family protein [Paraferrimonas sp. SM1919]
MNIYGDLRFSDSYSIKLLLRLLKIPHTWHHQDQLQDVEDEQPQICPRVELDDGKVLYEANAILTFLVSGTQFFPVERWPMLKTLQWQYFEQGQVRPTLAAAKELKTIEGINPSNQNAFDAMLAKGHSALVEVSDALAQHDYITSNKLTIADFILYADIAGVDTLGIDMTEFPNVTAWLKRIEVLPNFISQSDAIQKFI